MPPDRRLKLRAEDERDLAVIGACLQDALVPLADMLYEPERERFAMVVNRFMWEAPPEPAGPEEEEDGEPGERFARVHGIVSLLDVTGVQVRGLDRRGRGRPLCLLAVRPGEGCILFEFAGGGTIRAAVRRIRAFLEDVGEPWPTRWRPAHPD